MCSFSVVVNLESRYLELYLLSQCICEDSSLLEYDTELVDEWLPALWTRLLHPLFDFVHSLLTTMTLKMGAASSSKTVITAYQLT